MTVKLGILGGQGALATAEFLQRLTLAWAEAMPCSSDEDHLSWEAICSALPGLTLKGLERSDVAYPELLRRGANLKANGACYLAVPCNSLSQLSLRLEEELCLPVLTPLRATPVELLNSHVVLGSASTRKALRQKSVLSQHLDECIELVVRGKLVEARAAFDLSVSEVSSEKILLACTELSCLRIKQPAVVDSMDYLVSDIISHFTKPVL